MKKQKSFLSLYSVHVIRMNTASNTVVYISLLRVFINNMLYVDLCACTTILFFPALCSFENPTDELNLVWWREQRPTSCNWIFKRATANQSFSVRRSWMCYVLRATHGWLFMPLIFQDSSQIVVILAIAVLITPSLTISYHHHLFHIQRVMCCIVYTQTHTLHTYLKYKLGIGTGMGMGLGLG